MQGSRSLGAGLAGLAQIVEAKRAALLKELSLIDRELETIKAAAAVADRHGYGIAPEPRVLAPAAKPASTPHRPTSPPSVLRRPTDLVPFPRPSTSPPAAQPRPTDYDLRRAIDGTIGPARNDAAIPSLLDDKGRQLASADLPKDEAGIRALEAGVHDIAETVQRMPPGAGGRGKLSTKGLLPGEPVTPMLRAVFKAADRPLSSSEAALALLKARGLEYRGRELTAVVNRVSALLVQEAKSGRVGRAPTNDKRRQLWIWTRRSGEQPERGDVAEPAAANVREGAR